MIRKFLSIILFVLVSFVLGVLAFNSKAQAAWWNPTTWGSSAQTATLTGRLIGNGQPLTGAIIFINGWWQSSVKTDSNGNYSIPDSSDDYLGPSTQKIIFTSYGSNNNTCTTIERTPSQIVGSGGFVENRTYGPYNINLTCTGAGTTAPTTTVSPTTAPQSQTGWINGYIRDNTNHGLANATVYIDNNSIGRPNSDGFYQKSNLSLSSHTVSATLTGYTCGPVTVALTATSRGARADIICRAGTAPPTVPPSQGCQLAGYVYDANPVDPRYPGLDGIFVYFADQNDADHDGDTDEPLPGWGRVAISGAGGYFRSSSSLPAQGQTIKLIAKKDPTYSSANTVSVVLNLNYCITDSWGLYIWLPQVLKVRRAGATTTVPQTGTIKVKATFDGNDWPTSSNPGPLKYKITDQNNRTIAEKELKPNQPQAERQIPNLQPGQYKISVVSGQPQSTTGDVGLAQIQPCTETQNVSSCTQNLAARQTLTFNFIYKTLYPTVWISWDTGSAEPDDFGYRITRQKEGEEELDVYLINPQETPEPGDVTEVSEGGFFIDGLDRAHPLPKGKYTYRIYAFDRAANESSPTEIKNVIIN